MTTTKPTKADQRRAHQGQPITERLNRQQQQQQKRHREDNKKDTAKCNGIQPHHIVTKPDKKSESAPIPPKGVGGFCVQEQKEISFNKI